MRDFAHFLWRCIESSVRLTWDTAATIGVISGVILAIILVTHPEKQQSAGGVLAKLTILILVAVFLARLVASPYFVYRSRDGELAERDNTITELRNRNKQLEDNNELGKFLKQQAEASRKGSLSNRASTLAAEILDVLEKHRKDSDRINDEERTKMMSATDNATREAAWNEMTQKSQTVYVEFDSMFNKRFTPRILAIADEFRSNGLSDPKLDQWVQHPHTAAAWYTLSEVSVALSQLALKMEDKEKGLEPSQTH